MHDGEDRRARQAAWLVGLLVSMCLLAYVARFAPGLSFYSGDGGLKFALVQQHATGHLGREIQPPDEDWARALWHEGLAPFAPPFAYQIDGRLVVAFPPLFPLLSTPGYLLFGYLGLYLLPIAGVALSASGALLLARRLGAGFPLALLAAAGVLASPLVLYGATFWEHAPAAAAATLSAVALLGRGPSGAAALGGALAALAAGLRPETALFSVLLVVSIVVLSGDRGPRRAALVAGGVLAAGLVALALANVLEGGGATGLHGRQITFDLWRGRWHTGSLLPHLVECFPACALALGALWRPEPGEGSQRPLALAAGLAALGVPYIVPNIGGAQLGPRYLVFLLPILSALAVAVLARALRQAPRLLSWPLALVLVALLALGLRGVVPLERELRFNYANRISSALEVARARPERVVAFTHPWNALEFASLLPDRALFLVRSERPLRRGGRPVENPEPPKLARLVDRLTRHGIDRFLLVEFNSQPRHPAVLADAPVRLELLYAGGQCAVYAARIRASGETGLSPQ